MNLPNFRLFGTQARAGMLVGVLSACFLAALTYCVFHGFQPDHWSIPYNDKQGMGQYRNWLVMGLTPFAMLAGLVAGLLGYSSLGEKRNDKPSYSWFGMLLGAAVVAVAPTMFFFWRTYSAPILK